MHGAMGASMAAACETQPDCPRGRLPGYALHACLLVYWDAVSVRRWVGQELVDPLFCLSERLLRRGLA
jgi:hypothetical protein